MLFKSFSLTCLFLIKLFIQPTICAAPDNIQNLELDDVSSLWDKFPLFIDKIKEAVNRFRCPKGWKRLGGSCYYFSNLTSISSHANHTCNHLHSNLSNLMQIRNAVELFYAAHVLSRNNLSSLMIDIDPNLLQGKKITEMLRNDQGRWKRMKEKFQEVRVKYQKLRRKIVDRLSSTGLRILRRSKKIKPIPPKQESIHDDSDFDQSSEYEYNDRELNPTPLILSNNTTINVTSIINNDEYEYDDLDSTDESDEFEQMNDIRGICHDIHWNVLNHTNNSTVYILTKYNMSNTIICSLSDADPQTKYHHVCEYVLDFCFANILCGKHGSCVNTLTGFQCSCSFLYGGLLCEKISEHGYQIIVSFIIIMILAGLSFKPIRVVLWFIVKLLIKFCRKHCKQRKQKKVDNNEDTQHLVAGDRLDNDNNITDAFHSQQRRPTIAQQIMQIVLQRSSNPLLSPIKRNLVRNIWVGTLSVIFLTLLFVITTVMYYISFGYNLTTDEEHFSINDTIRLITDCAHISDYRQGNLTFAPCACVLIIIFSWSVKRESLCLDMCEGRPGLIPPIEPFRTGNRFTTATVFGILAFEVLKIFEELLFTTGQPLEHGVLIELVIRIALIILVGLRYYPVLASLQLRNIVARFFACLYIICNIIYTIVREGSCMGFLPLSGQYTALEEAKLRRELGTWFIVYGLIKNIPHFFFLSYIGAELCVRFAYDSIYIPIKKKESIWSAPIVQSDESEFAKYYVTKLFRRNRLQTQIITEQNTNSNYPINHQHESRFTKLINYIYHFDDDFRFTTIALSTYTVAVVFLYYLACTFVFLYISRTTGHVAFLKFYFESAFNVDLGAFSLKNEIIASAILTAAIYAGQLFIGMQNYKKHKLQLYKGIYVDIPPLDNFKPGSIASNSVHYSGFLVGYMAWGFVICFHLILLIFIGIRVLSLQIRHIEIGLGIIVPILLIYLLKMLSMTSAGKFLFVQKKANKLNKLNLKSRKIYAVFVYFSFFADCFLGIASCIIRLIKATCLNVIFMARLDWSFLGRPLERFDIGFAAYVSYLHMEVTYTNPVMLAFCYSLYDDIVQQRGKHGYVDECCIAPSESGADSDTGRENQVQQNRTSLPGVIYRRIDNNDSNGNESVAMKSHPGELSSIENMSQIELKNRSIVKENNINKRMKQRSNISDEEKQSNTSTTVRQQLPCGPGPRVPPREDQLSEQDASDGGIDGDESFKPKSFSTVEKLIPKPQPRLTSPTQSSKIDTDNRTDEAEDEDGSIPIRKESIKKKNLKKRKKGITKSNISQEDDGGRVDKPYDPMKTIIPSKQPKLDSRKTKDASSSCNTDNDDIQPGKHPQDRSSTTHDTIGQKALKSSDNIRNIKHKKTTDENQYDIFPTEEERATQVTTSYPPPSHNLATNPADIYRLRTISYRQAQQRTPLLTLHQSHISSSIHHQHNRNDDSCHYSEITTDTIRPGVNNRSYSKAVVVEASSSHSNKQQIPEEQKQNNDTNVESEEEEEEDRFLKASPTSSPIQSAVTLTMDTTDKSKEAAELKRIQRRKQLRFRWHFLYTMINNYHLFDLRKNAPGRLTGLHVQRNLVDQQQFTASPMTEVSKTPKGAAHSTEIIAQGDFEQSMSEIPTTIGQRPSPPRRFLSVPVSISSDYPSSPTERYIAIRAQMIYDSNTQQSNTPYTAFASRTPTTASAYTQQLRSAVISNTFSDQSLGFRVSPNIIVHPPSERSMKSGGMQTTAFSTERALPSESITSSVFQPVPASNQSTADYPLETSSVINSSIFRSQMSHVQHMQLWRQDQVGKIQKKQRHGYVYDVPTPPSTVDRLSSTTILSPQIIFTTKQQTVPPTLNTDEGPRRPTPSPFPFPLPRSQVRSTSSSTVSDTQLKTKKQRLKRNRPQQEVPTPPQRMDRLDEDPQETPNANKSSKVTSALIHRKDSQSSITDITEV